MKLQKIHYLLIVSFIFYSVPFLFSTQLSVSDEVDYYYFSDLVSNEGKITFNPKWDQFFGLRGFIPNHFRYLGKDIVGPKGFPGFILLAALCKLLLPDSLVFLLNPLLGVICVFLIYRISRIILQTENSAIYAALLLATTPVFIHWTNFFFPDILSLTLFLVSFLALLKIGQSNTKMNYVLFGIASGLLMWIRISNVLLIILLWVYILLNKKLMRWKFIIISAFLTTVIVALLLLFNFFTYGGLLNVGYTYREIGPFNIDISPQSTKSSFRTLGQFAFRIRPNVILSHLLNFPRSFSLAFPPFLVSLLGIYYGLKRKEKRTFYLFFLILASATIISFANFQLYGSQRGNFTLQASYLRYLLPFFAFLPIASIDGLSKLKLSLKKLTLLLMIINLLVASFGPFGIVHSTLNKLYHNGISRFILNNTDEKTVIISSYWARAIYPERIVYSRVRRLKQENIAELFGAIISKGYSICLPYNERDKVPADILLAKYKVEKIVGPKQLHIFLKMMPVPIPAHVYPLVLYKVNV